MHRHRHHKHFACKLCGENLSGETMFKKHVKTVHKGECPEQFTCPEEGCGEKFVFLSDLRQHSRMKHKPSLAKHIQVAHKKTFECVQCSSNFSSKGDLKVHWKERHNGVEEKIPCELCDRKLARWHILHHMRIKHEIEHVECAQCNETFKNKAKLRSHEILTCLVKYQCDLCDEEFGLKEALAAHKDVHHREFKCDEQGCSFKAKTETELRSHVNQHYLESGQLWLIKRYIM